MVRTKSTPPGKKGTTQKGISGRTMEAIEAALPRDFGDDLNARQTEFVKQYLVDLNATQAAIRAGYSKNCASEIGYENLRKPQIMKAIRGALAEFGAITRTRIIDELGAIAFSDIGQVLDWDQSVEKPRTEGGSPDGKVAPVSTSRVTVRPSATVDSAVSRTISKVVMSDKGGLRVVMHDKLAALDKLARTLGMYQDDADPKSPAQPLFATIIYEGSAPKPPAHTKASRGKQDRDD
jgi:phage terminase small subunit